MNLWWRRLHISWLITIGCGFFLVGVALAHYYPSPVWASMLCFFVASILVVISLVSRKIKLLPMLIVGCVLIGLWRGSVAKNDLEMIAPYIGSNLVVSGIVKDDVTVDGSSMSFAVDSIVVGDMPIAGSVWVSSNVVDLKRSDKVDFSGSLSEGFGSFSAVMFRAKIVDIQKPEPPDSALAIRDWFAGLVNSAIPKPESDLGIGYLVGKKQALDPELVLALQVAGLTHVVVASGYNLTILVRLARKLFLKVSKYLSMLTSMSMVAVFVLITGMSPSMSRAGLVATLSLFAWYYGRTFHPLTILAISAAVTAAINPSFVWGDVGWQLSFSAFFGVLVLAPLMQSYFFGEAKVNFVGRILIETTAAQIATAPILVASFGQFSNVAIFSNLLVLPLVPIAMLLTFMAGIGALVLPGFATIIGLPATWLLGYMISVINISASFEWASVAINLPGWGVAVCYAVIVAACVYMKWVTGYKLRQVNVVV